MIGHLKKVDGENVFIVVPLVFTLKYLIHTVFRHDGSAVSIDLVLLLKIATTTAKSGGTAV